MTKGRKTVIKEGLVENETSDQKEPAVQIPETAPSIGNRSAKVPR